MNFLEIGVPALNIAVFAVFVIATMTIIVKVTSGSNKKSASAFYTGGAQFSGTQNGFAIAGDYLSAASFLGITGAIAFTGYDGLLYSIGFLVAWLVALLLVAEPLRNTGKYTMADVLSFRMENKPVRLAAAISTLVISFFYLLAQMAGAGGLVSLLLGLNGDLPQNIVIVIVGALMVAYVLVGGMKGTTWVQMIKAVLLVAGAGIMTVWVLAQFGFNLSNVMDAALVKNKDAGAAPRPVVRAGRQVQGSARVPVAGHRHRPRHRGLPHMLMRFYTVPTARRPASRCPGHRPDRLVLPVHAGAGLRRGCPRGQQDDQRPARQGQCGRPALAFFLPGQGTPGSIFLAVISGVAFATILAVVAGLTIAASASFSHDIYNSVMRNGKADPADEVRVARMTVLVIGALAIFGGIFAKSMNIAFLVALAFAVAASANLPSILFSLYWKRFNTRGSIWSIYGGLIISLVLIIFSPAVSTPIGSKTKLASAMFPDASFAWFPWDNPALISVPLSFLLAYLGTVSTGKKDSDYPLKQAEMEVRSMTGAGAEGAIAH